MRRYAPRLRYHLPSLYFFSLRAPQQYPTEEFETHDFESWRDLSRAAEANTLRTPRYKLLIPEIIVLTRYDAVPPRRVKLSRRNLFERDAYTCQYCGRRPARSELSVDHVVPRSRGGATTWTNVLLSCTDCNARKRDLLPREAGMRSAPGAARAGLEARSGLPGVHPAAELAAVRRHGLLGPEAGRMTA